MTIRAKRKLTDSDSDDDDIPQAKRLKKREEPVNDVVESQRSKPSKQMVIANKQNRFVCNICRKTFAQKSVLTSHKWIIHRGKYIF
jgi:hypothetical protein